MDRNLYYIGIAFFGMVNGLFNPLMPFAYVFSKVLMFVPALRQREPHFLFRLPDAVDRHHHPRRHPGGAL